MHTMQELTSSTILKGFKSVMRLNDLWKLFLGDNFSWFWKNTSKNMQRSEKKNLDLIVVAIFLGRELRSIFVWLFHYLFCSAIDIPVTMALIRCLFVTFREFVILCKHYRQAGGIEGCLSHLYVITYIFTSSYRTLSLRHALNLILEYCIHVIVQKLHPASLHKHPSNRIIFEGNFHQVAASN